MKKSLKRLTQERIFGGKRVAGKKLNILFVCRHNRFRSQVAEDYFNQINKNKNVKARSAGLFPGEPISPRLKKLALKHGIKIRGRPRGITFKMLRNTDIVVAVSDDIPAKIFNYGPYKNKVLEWKIKDEYAGVNKKIEERIVQIKKKVEEFVKKLK